jgi:membrane-associated PAP2 superfamily phosphatase
MNDSIRGLRGVSVLRYSLIQIVAVPVLLAALALYAHESGLDFRIQNLFYDPVFNGFPWRKSVSLELIGHQLVKIFPIGLFLTALGAAIASRWVPNLRQWRPLLWALAIALGFGPTVVTQLKQVMAPHCPWDLKMYGGYADYVTDWIAASPAASGRCLPSGHSGAGFSLLALYFAGWAIGRPSWRWWGLAIGIVAGIIFSVVRIVQGAHFLSHALWAAMTDWLLTSLVFLPLVWRANRGTQEFSPASAIAQQ